MKKSHNLYQELANYRTSFPTNQVNNKNRGESKQMKNYNKKPNIKYKIIVPQVKKVNASGGYFSTPNSKTETPIRQKNKEVYIQRSPKYKKNQSQKQFLNKKNPMKNFYSVSSLQIQDIILGRNRLKYKYPQSLIAG